MKKTKNYKGKNHPFLFISTVKMDRKGWGKNHKGYLDKKLRTFLISLGKKGIIPYQEDMSAKWDGDFDYYQVLVDYGKV